MSRQRLPQPIPEFRFAPPRQWKMDFAWPELGLALEIEGGTYMQGRHNRGAAYAGDCEKYNTATLAGWRVLRVTVDMFRDGSVFQIVERALTTPIQYRPTVLVATQEAEL